MTEKQKRRWFQFSLRALLVFVVLVSIGMSCVGVILQRTRAQREAVKAVRKVGGSVEYAGFLQLVCPEWALMLFRDVVWVDVSNAGFGDAGLEHLGGLTCLKDLNLSGTQVTDAGLERLEELPYLTALDLSGTQVTDAGLEHLKGLNNLWRLKLDNTQVTGAGLEHLEGLTYLEWLYLDNTQVTDAGLEHLEGLTRLRTLDLYNTQVTTQGVKSLRQALPNCSMSFESQP